MGLLRKKDIEKIHLCRHDKSYYFCKSNIPVINLILGSRNLIKVSRYEFVKNYLTNTDDFLVFFNVFEWGRFLKNAMDKWKVKCNVKLRPNYFPESVSILAAVFRRQISKS